MRSYFNSINGIVVIFDLNSSESFNKAKELFLELKSFVRSECKFVLLGNKHDKIIPFSSLFLNLNQIIQEFIKLNNITYFEVSCLTCYNVDNSINYLVQCILKSYN